jgi:hypothetical protein
LGSLLRMPFIESVAKQVFCYVGVATSV